MARTIISLALIAALALTAGASAQTPEDPCLSNSGARNSTEMQSCLDHIDHATFSSDKIDALGACIKGSNRGFTGQQVVSILKEFTFSDDMITAINMMEDYILGMTCADAAAVLGTYSFSSDKLNALKTLVHASAIVDVKNSETVVAAFTFSSDKDDARTLLAGMKARSCIYGKVIAKRVVFVVDTSGSMSTTFSVDGKSWNRLQYVANELNTVIQGLDSTQHFDVLRFSSSVQEWQPGLVQVSSANQASAVSFVNSWTADGGTNINGALQAAYAFDDVEAVYLLSDGTPSVGISSVTQIISNAVRWSKGTIPCNTIAFLEGTFSGDNKAASQSFMSQLASATGGSYRVLIQ